MYDSDDDFCSDELGDSKTQKKGATKSKQVENFLDWLSQNGARFEKIDWPSDETASGIRGAVALETIATDEPMITIPKHLMISPPTALADPVMGHIFRDSVDILRGDLFLTVYLMYEKSKQKDSFYYPYLAILPVPDTICEWIDEELQMLHDERLMLKAIRRRNFIKSMYIRTFKQLNDRYPNTFPEELYPLESFLFCYYTITARAFGRRLPWTALVPFADCLNHANKQTKYDFDIDNNGVFRLFPTGHNHYPIGGEVFNSYGRRSNDNLLMDYGFAMLCNEWQEVEVIMELLLEGTDEEVSYVMENASEKQRVLARLHLSRYQTVKMSVFDFPNDAIRFCRIISMTAEDLAVYWENEEQRQVSLNLTHLAEEDSSDDGQYSHETRPSLPLPLPNSPLTGTSPPSLPLPSFPPSSSDLNSNSNNKPLPPRPAITFQYILSLENEILALSALIRNIQRYLVKFETTWEQDLFCWRLLMVDSIDSYDSQEKDSVTQRPYREIHLYVTTEEQKAEIKYSGYMPYIQSVLLSHNMSCLQLTIESYTRTTNKEHKMTTIATRILKDDAYWRSISALTHRLTRKIILQSFIAKCEIIRKYLGCVLRLPEYMGDNPYGWGSTTEQPEVRKMSLLEAILESDRSIVYFKSSDMEQRLQTSIELEYEKYSENFNYYVGSVEIACTTRQEEHLLQLSPQR